MLVVVIVVVISVVVVYSIAHMLYMGMFFKITEKISFYSIFFCL